MFLVHEKYGYILFIYHNISVSFYASKSGRVILMLMTCGQPAGIKPIKQQLCRNRYFLIQKLFFNPFLLFLSSLLLATIKLRLTGLVLFSPSTIREQEKLSPDRSNNYSNISWRAYYREP
jgi:hypothetical protein